MTVALLEAIVCCIFYSKISWGIGGYFCNCNRVQAFKSFNVDPFTIEYFLFQIQITAWGSTLQSEGFLVQPAVYRNLANTCIAQPWGSSCLLHCSDCQQPKITLKINMICTLVQARAGKGSLLDALAMKNPFSFLSGCGVLYWKK